MIVILVCIFVISVFFWTTISTIYLFQTNRINIYNSKSTIKWGHWGFSTNSKSRLLLNIKNLIFFCYLIYCKIKIEIIRLLFCEDWEGISISYKGIQYRQCQPFIIAWHYHTKQIIIQTFQNAKKNILRCFWFFF